MRCSLSYERLIVSKTSSPDLRYSVSPCKFSPSFSVSASPIPITLDKIKRAYLNVPGGLNVNSMVLFSGEIDHGLRQYRHGGCGG